MLTEDFLKGRRRAQLSPDDVAALEKSLSPVRVIPARTLAVPAGRPISASTLLVEGFMLRYMDDQEGRRQIVGLQLPGDFVDLHGYPLGRLDHNIATLSECRIVTANHAEITGFMQTRPALSKLLWFSTLLDAAMHREWIFRIGRLDALGRIAHIMCEIEARLRAVGRSDGHRFAFPATQADLAEMCGITSVHVNRVLGLLRRRGLLSFQGGIVEIRDRAGLIAVADFDPAYLFLDETPDLQRLPAS